MKIYIAGKFEQTEKVRRYAELLELFGHTVTYKWFADGDVSPAAQAYFDALGVYEADVCVFIFEDSLPYCGAATELGMALARGKRVIVIGSGCNNVFLNLPNVEKIA